MIIIADSECRAQWWLEINRFVWQPVESVGRLRQFIRRIEVKDAESVPVLVDCSKLHGCDVVSIEWSHQHQTRAMTNQMWLCVLFRNACGDDLALSEQDLCGQRAFEVICGRVGVEDEWLVCSNRIQERNP